MIDRDKYIQWLSKVDWGKYSTHELIMIFKFIAGLRSS